MKKKKKILVILIATLMVFSSAFSVVYAADGYRSIKAWFGDINILNNGEKIGDDVPRFMVDGLIYVPIQKVGEFFDKNWSWDQATRTMRFTDKGNQQDPNQKQNNMMMFMQLLEKEEKIKELEEKVKTLEKELEKKEEVTDVDDLEKELEDDFDKIEDVDVKDIELDEKGSDDIEVKIEVDLDDDRSEWGDVSNSELENYLEDIYDKIKKEIDDVDDIDGEFETNSSRYKDFDFRFTSSGNARFDRDGRGRDGSIGDLEDKLNEDYDKIDNNEADVNIKLSGDEDDIDVDIRLKNSNDDDEYNDLSSREIKDYLENLCEDILDEFHDARIDGKIEDSDGHTELTFDIKAGDDENDLDID